MRISIMKLKYLLLIIVTNAYSDNLSFAPNASQTVTGVFWQATQPISATSLPLPTGASTSSLQSATNTKLDALNTTLGTPLQSGGSVTNANLDVALSTRLKPADTLSAVTTVGTITNPVTANIGTVGTVSTSTKQSDGSQKTQVVDSSGNVIGATGNALDVNLKSGGFATSANQATSQSSLSTIVTNTGNSSTSANQTNGTQLTRITNGTQTADTVGGDSGQNGLVLNPAVKSITYTGITATTASIDIGNYKSISIMTSAISGSWTVQASNDNVNWLSAPMVRSDTGAFSASLAVNVIYKGSTWGRYFRILAGTSLTASISFSANPDPSTAVVVTPTGGAVFSASQSGSWTVTSNGGQASGASLSGNPTRIGAAFNTTQPTVTTGQAVDVQASNRGSLYVTNGVEGALINKPYAVATSDWNYAAASGGISNTTTAVTIAPAAGGVLRNYVTAIQLSTTALGVSTELVIRDGAGGTVLWRGTLSTTAANPSAFTLPSPIKGSANTLMEVVTLTASVTGSVYFNAQGYTAP